MRAAMRAVGGVLSKRKNKRRVFVDWNTAKPFIPWHVRIALWLTPMSWTWDVYSAHWIGSKRHNGVRYLMREQTSDPWSGQ